MEFKEALKKLEKSKEFANWNKKNPDTFLSYALKMLENNKEQPWQLGFYHKTTDKIVTFTIDQASIEFQAEEEVFKKPDMEIKPIDIKKVKLSFKDILEKAENFQKKTYPKELVNKTIVILQNLKEYGDVWNITFLTHSFNTINIKANIENGKIAYHNIDSLMSFVKK